MIWNTVLPVLQSNDREANESEGINLHVLKISGFKLWIETAEFMVDKACCIDGCTWIRFSFDHFRCLGIDQIRVHAG